MTTKITVTTKEGEVISSQEIFNCVGGKGMLPGQKDFYVVDQNNLTHGVLPNLRSATVINPVNCQHNYSGNPFFMDKTNGKITVEGYPDLDPSSSEPIRRLTIERNNSKPRKKFLGII